MINMKNLDPNIIKIDENSNNNIFIIDTLKKAIEVDI